MSKYRRPIGNYQDVSGTRRGLEKDAHDDLGMGDDLLFIFGFVWRIVSWPFRAAVDWYLRP